uniref:Translation initiation factor 3 N-terminal domain-containing protein n=1 Tax=Aegilops tauschii subsp. strangulata TaxID=200361 RepID=A0A453M4V7_AEGTS
NAFVPFLPPPPPMALRRAIGSLVVRSQAYYLRRAAPSPPPSLSRPIIPYRPFAAPPQHAKKVTKDDDDDAGPRINNDITAPFLRLVTDEGHSVVPRHETLQLAARMGLDLVEVHRKTDPPVCKIMDFHKEKYNKDVKEKERLKTKSAIVLHGGDNKEVRFKAKTEIKDLKVKADAITRLMERGYRVKCMAMPAGNEAEDLGGPLSQLLGLIQDVSIVESGPHLDSKHAYVIVRHVKFATKKGGKKASKAMEDAGKGTPSNTACESPATATNSGDKTSEHGLEVEDVDKTPAYYSRDSLAQKERQDRGVGGSNRDNMDNVSAGGNRINPSQGGSQSSEHGLGSRSGNSHMEKREKTNQDMVPEQTNRYASRRQQMGGVNQGRPPQDPRRNENEARHRFNDNQRPLEQSSPPSPRLGQGRPPQDPRRNERRSHVPSSNNNQPPRFQQSNQNSGPLAGRDAGSPTPTARSLGVFSSRTQATTSEPKKADGASAAGKPSDTSPTKSFGIF